MSVNGKWQDGNGDIITITQSGNDITAKYDNGRGPFHGTISEAGEIHLSITDDPNVAAQSGTLQSNQIVWKNETVWRSVRGAGSIVGGSASASGKPTQSKPAAPPVPESEPNDSEEQANNLAIDGAVSGKLGVDKEAGDQADYFVVTIPSSASGKEGAGGILTLSTTSEDEWNKPILSCTEFGQPEGNDSFSDAGTLFAREYYNVGAGKKYRIIVRGAGSSYTISASYAEVLDPYEPNDSQENAFEAVEGKKYTSILFSPFTGASQPTYDQDNFKFAVPIRKSHMILNTMYAMPRVTVLDSVPRDLPNPDPKTSDIETDSDGTWVKLNYNIFGLEGKYICITYSSDIVWRPKEYVEKFSPRFKVAFE